MGTPRLAALGLAAALAVSPFVASTAFAATSHARHQATVTNHATKAQRAGKKSHPAKSQTANHGKRPVTFTATGVVTAVDPVAGTLTVADKGGSRDLHGTSVMVTVAATTSVEVDDAAATLSDVNVGDHVAANGVRSVGPVFTARHVNAETVATSDGSSGG